MANRNPSPSTRIKKGQVLNPTGKPKGLLTGDKVKKAISDLYKADKEKLEKVLKSRTSTALDMHIAAIIVKGIQKGDAHSLEMLLQRAIGKIREEQPEDNEALKSFFKLSYDLDEAAAEPLQH